MTWTIGRRIGGALAIELALLVAVAIVGVYALRRTNDGFDEAFAVRTREVAPALQAEVEIRGANVEQVRLFLTGEPRYGKARDSMVVLAQGVITNLRDSSTTASDSARWASARSLLARWNTANASAASDQIAGDRADAMRTRVNTLEPLRAELDSLIREGVRAAQHRASMIAQNASFAADAARQAILFGTLAALLIGVVTGYFISRSINRPLRESASIIAASGAQILAATTEQAASTNQSMAAVTETVATVDEVAQTATQSAQRARLVADAAQRAAEGGRAGRQAVVASVAAMQLVQTQVETMARGIVALAEQAQAIGEITTAVSDIAEQTKLLALNAAVESTRAGEHGRGFALVAAEIKALAGEAKESTTQVRRLLGEIQRATSTAVMATEQGTKQTAAAVRQVGQAGDIIAQLSDAVEESAQAAAQIVASAGQQALGMDQIRQAIANIHDATQQNLTATRQTELAAQNLTSLGTQLVGMVGARDRL
ncbi:MAG: methyl-accepting chemotaxis protein [Gemmatimonadaceae bacterium]